MGTSGDILTGIDSYEDHPHACGDKQTAKVIYMKAPGSSPRVWGQALFISALDQSRRIIPTRVGTSVGFGGKSAMF